MPILSLVYEEEQTAGGPTGTSWQTSISAFETEHDSVMTRSSVPDVLDARDTLFSMEEIL